MDSELMGIDNRCSACISHQIKDFIDILQPTQHTITGFMGSKVSNVQQGTILWRWEDDDGRVHKHTIPNSFFYHRREHDSSCHNTGCRQPGTSKVPAPPSGTIQYSSGATSSRQSLTMQAMWPHSTWPQDIPTSNPSAPQPA